MQYLLFTTTTCPKCPAVKSFVAEQMPFDGRTLDNSAPDFVAQIQKFGVQNAPTLIVLDDANQEIFRGNEVAEIEEFLNRK
ncbi:MAG: thioredoxin family protein [Patescibacteria group bacterium]